MSGPAGEEVDVAIVGGGPAGLTAALYLGRARKKVAVVDLGTPRHAASKAVHNLLTRDGTPPAQLRAEAWAQMAAYPTVTHALGATVTALEWSNEHWLLGTAEGRSWRARAVLLSTGVLDEHPAIPGYEERWARSIHQCPYCHGWEMRDLPLALLASGDVAAYMAGLLLGWSADVAVVSNGAPMAEAPRQAIANLNIRLFEAPIVRLDGPGTALESIHFADGSQLQRQGMFVALNQRQVPLVQALDMDLTDKGFVPVDEEQRTSLPMLWAAGDLTSHRQQVVEAAAQGGRAATSMNAALTLPS